MKRIFNFAMRLGLLCMLSGILLSFVYKNTKPKIEYNKIKASDIAKKEIMPSAVRFEQKNDSIFIAYDENNKIIGKISTGVCRGYGGPVKVMVGVDNSGRITGVKVIEQTETPGLGDEIVKKNFTSQFINKIKAQINSVKNGGQIDTITGATISSKACIEAVKKSLEGL